MNKRDVIAIGGSTGAIDAVKRLCRDLPPDFAATLFIVIHVGAHGVDRLADIFGADAPFPVTTATEGEVMRRGHAYVAPADHHLLIIDGVARLGRGPRENMARPAIDPLFRSVAMSYGPRAIAVVLTGMLNDGAAGLADVKRCGGTTVVQSPADAVAPDMPWGALSASDIDYRAPLSQMAALLADIATLDADPPVLIPSDIRIEADIALGRNVDSRIIAGIADPVSLSCPACGGVLSQMRQGPPLRFRCQVGHGYTAESLASEKEDTVDEALRVALRIMEERAVLTEKMANDAGAAGRSAAAASYRERSRESRAYADTLRRGIEEM